MPMHHTHTQPRRRYTGCRRMARHPMPGCRHWDLSRGSMNRPVHSGVAGRRLGALLVHTGRRTTSGAGLPHRASWLAHRPRRGRAARWFRGSTAHCVGDVHACGRPCPWPVHGAAWSRAAPTVQPCHVRQLYTCVARHAARVPRAAHAPPQPRRHARRCGGRRVCHHSHRPHSRRTVLPAAPGCGRCVMHQVCSRVVRIAASRA